MKLLTVFGLGTVELWAAVPAGVALQLHPVTAGVTAAIGAIVGVVVVLAMGERVRTTLLRWYGGTAPQRPGRMQRIWTQYGVVGLGLLAPLLVGAPLGTALGIALGAPASRLLLWMSLGIALCTAALTGASVLGVAGIQALAE